MDGARRRNSGKARDRLRRSSVSSSQRRSSRPRRNADVGGLLDRLKARLGRKDYDKYSRYLISKTSGKAQWLRELETLNFIKPKLRDQRESRFARFQTNLGWMQHIDLPDLAKGPLAYDGSADAGLEADSSFIGTMGRARAFIETELETGAELNFSLYNELHRIAMGRATGNNERQYRLDRNEIGDIESADVEQAVVDKITHDLKRRNGEATPKKKGFSTAQLLGIDATMAYIRATLNDNAEFDRNESALRKALDYANQLHPTQDPPYFVKSGWQERVNYGELVRIIKNEGTDEGMSISDDILLSDHVPAAIQTEIRDIDNIKDAIKRAEELITPPVMLKFSRTGSSQTDQAARLNRYFRDYNHALQRAYSDSGILLDKQAVIDAIAQLTQRLERSHPYADGNGRSHLALMNALLVNNGLSPVMLDSPHISHLISSKDWANEIKTGQKRYQTVSSVAEKVDRIWNSEDLQLHPSIVKALAKFDRVNRTASAFKFNPSEADA